MSVMFSAEEIEQLVSSYGIDAKQTYVVGQKRNTLLSGILKLLVSNLWYAIDGATIRIIAFTEKGLLIINPNRKLNGQYKDLPEKYRQIIPFDQLQELSVTSNGRTGRISWKYQGKKSMWDIPLYNPGVFHFNPNHFAQLQKQIRRV